MVYLLLFYYVFLILKIHNKIIINIPNYLFNNSYELICAEIYPNRGKLNNNFFSYLCTSCSKNKKNKYEILYNKIDEDKLNNSLPYVLFYKRINEMAESEEESLEDINTAKKLISNDKSLHNDNKLEKNYISSNNEVNNINNNLIDNNKENYTFDSNSNINIMDNNMICMNNNINFMDNNNINSMNNNNMNSINNNNMIFKNNNMNDNFNNNNIIDNVNNQNDKNNFLLYFRFKKNGKEIFIDTNENETFSNIVVQIKMKYDWTIQMINDNNLYYNNKKINPKKSPKQLKIPEESRIMIN